MHVPSIRANDMNDTELKFLLDRKGERVWTLHDVVDFPLGMINYEMVGMP
jgi:hypothetical protein